MIEMECPWCSESRSLDRMLARTDDFDCDLCGTIVQLVDEPAESLSLAA